VAATDVPDLRRALERRTESLAILIALHAEALIRLPASAAAEVLAVLAEAHGALKAAARLADIGPVAIPSSNDREPAEL
jgi:hypothetical protein